MYIWHLTLDAPRSPHRVSADERVTLYIGTWPVEPAQSIWVTYRVEHLEGSVNDGRVDATWLRNEESKATGTSSSALLPWETELLMPCTVARLPAR